MFKNASLVRVSGLTSAGDLGAVVRLAMFAPCGPTQPQSVGFVPPREENGALVESVAGQWILAVHIQTRSVPAAEVDKHVDAQAKAIERETGRKPGKKQRRELKDQALLELMPNAFPKDTRVLVWIDPTTGLAAIDSSSAGKVDTVVSMLAMALGLKVAPVQMIRAPATTMTAWLHDGCAAGPFELGNECELRGESGVVRHAGLRLDTPTIKAHVAAGMVAKSLALDWNGKATFVLTDTLVLRKISLDVPVEGGHADAFDADVALAAGTLRPMLADLMVELGGEVVA